MGRGRRRPRLPQDPVEAIVTALSHDGRGIARIDGKTTFIHGALPDERVLFRYSRIKRSYDEGLVTDVLAPAPLRVAPPCAHYGICGGCSLQHLDPEQQIIEKQGILLDNLRQIGKVEPLEILPPLRNTSTLGYRRKARLGVKHVQRKGKVLVGFRERASSFIADIDRCVVLHPKVGQRLVDLANLIDRLSIRDQLPQIEVAMDDERCALIFRVLNEPSGEDLQHLTEFGEQFGFVMYLQPGGPDTVAPLHQPADLHYELPDQQVTLHFEPSDFTQVNTAINRQMVTRAIDLLELSDSDRVLDLFCGIGNFTLPLARRAAAVTGVEGDAALVQRARHNAERNGLNNVDFHTANLYDSIDAEPWLRQSFDKVLLDPPRSGAQQILGHLPRMGAQRIVYVSCYPGTLARDAGELVHQHGYRLVSAGVMDMFPHTAHVESIATFDRV